MRDNSKKQTNMNVRPDNLCTVLLFVFSKFSQHFQNEQENQLQVQPFIVSFFSGLAATKQNTHTY